MMTTASPHAKSNPAVIAAWWPKLRLKFKTLIVESAAAKPARIPWLSSVLPSLTKTISVSQPTLQSSDLQRPKSQLQIAGLIVDRDHNRKQHRLTTAFQCLHRDWGRHENFNLGADSSTPVRTGQVSSGAPADPQSKSAKRASPASTLRFRKA